MIDSYSGFYVRGSNGNRIYLPGKQEIKELSREVVKQMFESNFYPDMTLAIANGGTEPARYVEHYLSKAGYYPEPASIKLKSYSESGGLEDKKGRVKLLNHTIPEKYDPRNVLIIDDLVDTGDTAEFAIEWAEGQFGNDVDVRLSVIWYKDCSCIAPDFYGRKCNGDEWILLYKDFKEESLEELYRRRVIA